MTDRPILFSAPMIRALLDGRKTQTRRLATASNLMLDGRPIGRNPEVGKSNRWLFDSLDWSQAWIDAGPSPAGNPGPYWHVPCLHPEAGETTHRLYPIWQKGDRLWVRETFSFDHRWTGLPPRDVQWHEPVWYWANSEPTEGDWTKPKPGIHMPRWASRITLTVADVRVERLQEISEADAMEEGVTLGRHGFCVIGVEHPNKDFPTLSRPNAREMYAALWDVINGNGAWLANPWVVAITFTVEQRSTHDRPEIPRRSDRPLHKE